LFQPRCLNNCHSNSLRDDGHARWATPKADDLALVVVVRLPMARTNKDIHRNRAILISTALVTAILAMVASYVIVRYVVVKPVKHLRDVSDAIAAGKLTVRAQIQTGDDYEELSHAFNRMLHNLVAMQQELRDVNADLDRKVDELAQANLALFEMNRIKSDFLATMSHELRTPLNSIIGFSEILSESDQLSERQRRFASNIQSSGKMLLGMINDILDLAKIESGKMEIRVEDFSIRDVCEGLANLARPIAERKNIDLECRLDEAIPLLRQDPGKLRQIIYNLLSNAIKFTPEGGRVTLKAHAESRHVVVSVSDTGIGIAEEDRERIFEKFRQAVGSSHEGGVLTREHQGTGLGLSIVRELTKLIGGDVHLESCVGQGSTFTVRIPMQLPGNRKFDVNLSDERIDLSKAKRVDAKGPLSHLLTPPPDASRVPVPPASSPRMPTPAPVEDQSPVSSDR
jgi:signal transduction histidine kinase